MARVGARIQWAARAQWACYDCEARRISLAPRLALPLPYELLRMSMCRHFAAACYVMLCYVTHQKILSRRFIRISPVVMGALKSVLS